MMGGCQEKMISKEKETVMTCIQRNPGSGLQWEGEVDRTTKWTQQSRRTTVIELKSHLKSRVGESLAG